MLKGDSFASDYYWHGKIMTRYADDWVKLWTGGKGTFVMTEMEDSAVAEALRRLDATLKRRAVAPHRRLPHVAVGVDHARHGHAAAEVDDFSVFAAIDRGGFRAAHAQDLARAEGYGFDPRLIGITSVDAPLNKQKVRSRGSLRWGGWVKKEKADAS